MPSFDLARFETAQKNVYEIALEEIRAGRKRTHWMWFVFPQVTGLGFSDASMYFAIGSIAEAQGYLEHPTLGRRLREITAAMNENAQSDAVGILGTTDAAKFRSSMTLFSEIAPEESCFRLALDKFFQGNVDTATTAQISRWRSVQNSA